MSVMIGLLGLTILVAGNSGEPLTNGRLRPIEQAWDYTAAMRGVAQKGQGKSGVVIHVGDSIAYSNPYGQWARTGKGKTEEDREALAWMHSGSDDETDGWFLARFDHPDGGRSHTAAGGLRVDELLAGGKSNLPSLESMLKAYRPQAVVLMIGTNDATRGQALDKFLDPFTRCIDLILKQGVVPIVSTIPPVHSRIELSRSYNEAIRDLARRRSLPLIDFEREILQRRPNDWNGTLLGLNDVHPTLERNGVSPASEPTQANLRESGYLLRGWLSVQKIKEVKHRVFDAKVAAVIPKPKRTPPSGKQLRLPVTRDTWFSEVGAEADGNNGGSSKLKLKSYQEMALLDIDPTALRGQTILEATLHVRLAAEPVLKRVTVSSFSVPWVEGTSTSYEPRNGTSSFRHRAHPDIPWTLDGGDLCRVMLGQGGTLWKTADASTPDSSRWQEIPIDPAVASARVDGLSQGFLIFDDTGSEWTRDGEKYMSIPMPNRFISSRESGPDSAPYVTVILGPQDATPPTAPTQLETKIDGLAAGDAEISWRSPADQGLAGTLGFLVSIDGKPVPQSIVPLAASPAGRVRMRLRDLKIKPGREVSVAIRAVDGAGNVGPPLSSRIQVSAKKVAVLAGSTPPFPDGKGIALPGIGGAKIAIIDELDKVDSSTGAMIPPQPEGYLAANHLWNAGEKRIRLHAARNEFVSFQVLILEGKARPALRFSGRGSEKLNATFGRYIPVNSRIGPLSDPIVPLDGPDDIETAKSQSIHVELYVPHDVPPGDLDGILTLSDSDQTLSIAVWLHVWDFTLPDSLSFLPEMNCYGLPANERDYYRLAHRHRTVLNRVPYSQRGEITEGCAPIWDDQRLEFDWSAWDRRFGPYLDGTAFADLPRKGVPIECFYLPLNENWPTPIEPNYNGDYWADRAFTPQYRGRFVAASRQFAGHIKKQGWSEPLFHAFLNGKNDFKRNGWSRGSSPWLLDEPANFQDFWALRYFASAFHEGVRQAGSSSSKLVFRADVSRPQWQRNTLDGLLDYNVVGGAMRPYRRIVMDRKEADGQIVVEYGSANPVEESNMQAVGWSLDSWSLGSDGVLPWQTIGQAESWNKGDPLSLFYPPRKGKEPVPSVRLKAFRRGQQDVEYLTLLSIATGEPRWAIGERVREALDLVAVRGTSNPAGGAEDAGLLRYKSLRPQDAWALRMRVGEAISGLHPVAKRRLVEMRPPPRDPSLLSPQEVGK